MAEVGPHLLGRKISPPDERDYRAVNFMFTGEGVAPTLAVEELATLAAQELTKTTITYKQWAARHYDDPTVTHWWKAFNYLSQIVNPTPPEPPVPIDDKLWESLVVLDQSAGQPEDKQGHCVGFGCAGWGITEPVEDAYTNSDGHAIYYEAKKIEGDPTGEDGAYTRDGAKAMVARKRMGTYAFLDTITDIEAWVRTRGPVIVGTDWTDDMFQPDTHGIVVPSGNVVGGHCYVLIGIEGDFLIFKQSWGASWGVAGYFKMLVSDFVNLFEDYGEAIASVELPL